MDESELNRRSNTEQNERVSVDAIVELTPFRPAIEFSDCRGLDIADPAAGEVTRTCVVRVVRTAPVFVRSHRDDPAEEAKPIGSFLRLQERAMTAVVLDDEGAHNESADDYGKRDGQPNVDGGYPKVDDGQQEIWNQRIEDLRRALRDRRFLEGRDNATPFITSRECFVVCHENRMKCLALAESFRRVRSLDVG